MEETLLVEARQIVLEAELASLRPIRLCRAYVKTYAIRIEGGHDNKYKVHRQTGDRWLDLYVPLEAGKCQDKEGAAAILPASTAGDPERGEGRADYHWSMGEKRQGFAHPRIALIEADRGKLAALHETRLESLRASVMRAKDEVLPDAARMTGFPVTSYVSLLAAKSAITEQIARVLQAHAGQLLQTAPLVSSYDPNASKGYAPDEASVDRVRGILVAIAASDVSVDRQRTGTVYHTLFDTLSQASDAELASALASARFCHHVRTSAFVAALDTGDRVAPTAVCNADPVLVARRVQGSDLMPKMFKAAFTGAPASLSTEL